MTSTQSKTSITKPYRGMTLDELEEWSKAELRKSEIELAQARKERIQSEIELQQAKQRLWNYCLEECQRLNGGEVLAEIHSHVSPSDPYREESLHSRLLQSLHKRGHLEQSNDTESTDDNDEDDGEGEKSGTGSRR